MTDFKVDSVAVVSLGVASTEGWAFQVLASGSEFEMTAGPLNARLGGQDLGAVRVYHDGSGFSGSVKIEPQDGDKLFVNYAGFPLLDTGVTYRKQPPVA
jgi:hypothetical protein